MEDFFRFPPKAHLFKKSQTKSGGWNLKFFVYGGGEFFCIEMAGYHIFNEINFWERIFFVKKGAVQKKKRTLELFREIEKLSVLKVREKKTNMITKSNMKKTIVIYWANKTEDFSWTNVFFLNHFCFLTERSFSENEIDGKWTINRTKWVVYKQWTNKMKKVEHAHLYFCFVNFL